MSTKINVGNLVSQHLSSMKRQGDDGISRVDVATFYGVPLIVGALFYFLTARLKPDAISQIDNVLVAAFSIFAALLLNAQVLIIGLKVRSVEQEDETQVPAAREDIALRSQIRETSGNELSELFANVSYSILVSISLVAFTLIAIFTGISGSILVKAIQFSAVIHFCLTGLMVLKRMHVVFGHKI